MSVLSSKSRYALHGVAYVARRSGGAPVPFDEILAYLEACAFELTLSPGYLAKVFQSVSRARLLEAVPGPTGGYRLARGADEIRLLEVIEALEGPILTECCLRGEDRCPHPEECAVREVIRECEQAFFRRLGEQTVASIASRITLPLSTPGRGHDGDRPARVRRTAARS